MNNILLKPQVLLGFSGECSSSSCEAGQAKEYMKNLLKTDGKRPEINSAKSLEKLSREIEQFELQNLK